MWVDLMTYISVVMPARNAERTIAASVRSVLAHPEVGELIVVDDGSSDQTSVVAARLDDGRVRVVSGLAQGISAAMNTGVAASKYTLIARCDADDLLNKERFLFQLPWIIEQPDYVGISGGFQTITAKGGWIADLAVEGESREVTGILRHGAVFTHFCTWLFRKSAWEQIGGARGWFNTAEDIDLQIRLAFVGRVWHHPVPVYQYFLHDQSITHSRQPALLEFYDQTARRFACQRAERGSDDLDDGTPPEPPHQEVGTLGKNKAGHHAAGQLVGRAWQAQQAGHRLLAVRCAARAIRMQPTLISAWKALVLVVIKPVKKEHI